MYFKNQYKSNNFHVKNQISNTKLILFLIENNNKLSFQVDESN